MIPDSQLLIFSVFHKAYPVPKADWIKPIQVGRQASGLDLGFTSDDQGDNIADKNPQYCEQTALYWIWKHLDSISAEYIGLAHYRRYFSLPLGTLLSSRRKQDLYPMPLNERSLSLVASDKLKKKLEQILGKGKLILPRPVHFKFKERYPVTIEEQFVISHLREDWQMFEETIFRMLPNEIASFRRWKSQTEMSCYNMFIGDKNFIREYSAWLFPILAELEQVLPLSPHPYQQRMIGFLGERLLNFYVFNKKIPHSFMPVIQLH